VNSECADILAVGPSQGWQCGVTKIFIKDAVRFAIEAALNLVRWQKVVLVQCAVRRRVAQKFAKKRRHARGVIQ